MGSGMGSKVLADYTPFTRRGDWDHGGARNFTERGFRGLCGWLNSRDVDWKYAPTDGQGHPWAATKRTEPQIFEFSFRPLMVDATCGVRGFGHAELKMLFS